MVVGRDAVSIAPPVLCFLQVQHSNGKIYIAFCNTFGSYVARDNGKRIGARQLDRARMAVREF